MALGSARYLRLIRGESAAVSSSCKINKSSPSFSNASILTFVYPLTLWKVRQFVAHGHRWAEEKPRLVLTQLRVTYLGADGQITWSKIRAVNYHARRMDTLYLLLIGIEMSRVQANDKFGNRIVRTLPRHFVRVNSFGFIICRNPGKFLLQYVLRTMIYVLQIVRLTCTYVCTVIWGHKCSF